MRYRLHIRLENNTFTIQTAEDGYDYTFYNEDYQQRMMEEFYDNPTIMWMKPPVIF